MKNLVPKGYNKYMNDKELELLEGTSKDETMSKKTQSLRGKITKLDLKLIESLIKHQVVIENRNKIYEAWKVADGDMRWKIKEALMLIYNLTK